MPYIDWSAPGPNMDALRERTAGRPCAIHVFPGTDPNVTQDQIAAEILKAMDQVERGEAEELVFAD
jgi:hypothetical protein